MNTKQQKIANILSVILIATSVIFFILNWHSVSINEKNIQDHNKKIEEHNKKIESSLIPNDVIFDVVLNDDNDLFPYYPNASSYSTTKKICVTNKGGKYAQNVYIQWARNWTINNSRISIGDIEVGKSPGCEDIEVKYLNENAPGKGMTPVILEIGCDNCETITERIVKMNFKQRNE